MAAKRINLKQNIIVKLQFKHLLIFVWTSCVFKSCHYLWYASNWPC